MPRIKKCCIYSCSNFMINENDPYHRKPLSTNFFKIPRSVAMREVWRNILEVTKFNRSDRICSDHFEARFMNTWGICKRLSPDAIPTIFASSSHVSRPTSVELDINQLTEPIPDSDSVSSSLVSHELIIPDTEQEYTDRAETVRLTSTEMSFEEVIPDTERDYEEYTKARLVSNEMSTDGASTFIENNINLKSNVCLEKLKPTVTVKRSLETSISAVSSSQRKNIQRTTKLNVLRKSYREIFRRNLKIDRLESLLEDLKNQNLLQEEHFVNLLTMSEPVKEILKRQFRKSKGLSLPKHFPVEIREFVMILNFYSPRAYAYARKIFGCLLPPLKTIAQWYKCVDGKAGFTEESFRTLRLLVDMEHKQNQNIFCNLVFGEIGIRSQVEWDGKGTVGCVDIGNDIESEEVASHVLVFMIVGINKRWKIPIGYFPITTLNSDQKSNLLSLCIHNLYTTGVKIIGVTFDGCPVNFSLANSLGCYTNVRNCSDIDNLNPVFMFNDESFSESLVIFPDPCHMLKLIRNTLAEKGPLLDDNGEEISWRYLELLELVVHVFFKNQKINVKHATQALSISVADALEFCSNQLGLPQFQGCRATVRFIRIINNVFDVLNSRDMSEWGLKQPICTENIEQILDVVNSGINYIGSLKIMYSDHYQPVVMSSRKIGFVGMILSLKSINFIIEKFIKTELLQFVPFYKLNRDHLEFFFDSIRARSDSNNNPTVRQFMASYKRLLLHTQIVESCLENGLPLDELNILDPVNAINLTKSLQPNYNVGSNDNLTDEEAVFVTENSELF